MRYLICLALLGCAYGTPLKTDTTQAEIADRAAHYVLPRESFPSFYDVSLYFDPDNATLFTGSVSIRVIPNYSTQSIVMHAMELDIINIRAFTDIDSETNLFSNFTLAEDDTHFLTINFNQNIQALTPHTVVIDFTGRYAPDMFGVYISSYTDANGNVVNLVTSQLQPTFARRAFPCYDEPDMKAVFRITVYAPPRFTTVRGNMPLRTDLLKPEVTSYTKHEFQDTLVMSTYLLAFLVSNLEYIDNTANPIYEVPFRVYSRPGTQTTAQFALDYGQRNMAALEEYTEFAYAFPKMDHVAVPDFAAGAMENWGLVIYREVALLVQEGVTTTAVRQNIGRIICHENVHQWFGNEVGPMSWTYTWLNEGFANFFENFATDLVLPEWRMMDQFVATMHSTFQSDAVLTINPMTHEVYSPSEIIGTFNAIAYQKSGSVIRMAQHFLTPEVFRRGLVIYIQSMSRAAAAPLNLFNSLQQALDESNHTIPYTVNNVLSRWTTQGGFPVITVRRTANSADSVYVTQQRYLTDTSLSSSDRWHIPLNWVLSTDANFTDTSPQAWQWTSSLAQHLDIPGLAQAEWFLFNKQQTGYYRVNYDPENWEALARALVTSPAAIHVLNRAQLVDDVFNMARTGRLDYSYAFELSRYLHQEEDYIPWASANLAFTYLDVALSGSSAYHLYQAYVQDLAAPMYAALGFEASPTEEHVTPYHRNIVLNWNCRYGNQACLGAAQQMLQSYRDNPTESLNPDIQTVVFCSGLRGGDEDNFNFLWEQYLASSDASQQSILLNALGCTSNPQLRDFYLNQVISDDSSVREQDRHTIIVAVTNSGHENMEAALDFVIEHFTEIQPRVQGLTGTTNILNAFAARLTTQEHSNKIDDFYARYEGDFSAGELASVAAIRENIAASITWSSRHLPAVEGWLRANVSGASALSCSFAVIAAAFALFHVL